ncbi:MAG: hypothetical protein HY033_12970 [Ignavibacteriae bacterium]|nr:hypothetical protein [Ignavibacteria bacterium]MBI3365805.1 hypothetical protein [Ignavibacteriota bacterium]
MMNVHASKSTEPLKLALVMVTIAVSTVIGYSKVYDLASATPLPSLAAPTTDSMEVATAVMVTVELDFGSKTKKIADALQEIERRSVPDDGVGRTFAILDAYGEPTTDRKLHMSMHVSAEKAGVGKLVFRRTGEVLWNCRIVQEGKKPPAVKNLGIFIDDGHGNSLVLDGSKNPSSILEANVQGMKRPIRDIWPDGAVREVTFMYSACGCPVKVMVKRIGEKTKRTKELPVMFPDDPAVLAVIKQLMKW